MGKKFCSEKEILKIISSELLSSSKEVMIGIGDDCAVTRPCMRKGMLELIKTDALVEGIHYDPNASLENVGWKAVCRPVSDIAAMAGTPWYALVTVAAPMTWEIKEWKALYRGLAKASHACDISIIGGETVRSPGHAFLSVSVFGKVKKKHLRLRSGAHPGDLICVTGKLGGSRKSGRHLNFIPRLAEGQWLGKEPGVSAMMDLSDGLGSDLPKLASASNCSFYIALDSLPLHRRCSVAEGISDGEDYELLVTIIPRYWAQLKKKWKKRSPDISLTPIGVMLTSHENSTKILHGYDHFSPRSEDKIQ